MTSREGRITTSDIAELVVAHPNAEFFICGPTAFNEQVSRALAAADAAGDSIHVEDFVPQGAPAVSSQTHKEPSDDLPLPPRVRWSIPWLGNAGFALDPVTFQADGHARLGPVFSARLFGMQFIFFDMMRHPDFGRRVLEAENSELSVTAAYKMIAGKLLGEEVFDAEAGEISPGLTLPYIARRFGMLTTGLDQALRDVPPGTIGEVGGISLAAAASLPW